jgi:hypothetical protein
MADFHFVGPGKFWLLVDSKGWPLYVRSLKEYGEKHFKQLETVENRELGTAWIVADFTEETTFPGEIVKDFGEWVQGLDPWKAGLWKQPEPSLIHEAAETVDDVTEFASDAAKSVGSAISGAVTIAAVSAVGVLGFLWFTRNR